MKHRPPWPLIITFALVGFLLVVTGTATSVADQHNEPRKQAIIDQIMQERSDVDDLDKAVAQLRSQVEQAHIDAGKASQQQAEKNQTETQLAKQAGATAVKGSGITVKLSDAARNPGESDVKFDASRIQDSDLQLVVNALFAAGAEAIAINDNRVVAVSPIRAAGGTIVVNYRPIDSPYRVVAIGADTDKFNQSEIAQHFKEWKKKFRLGFSIDKSSKLSIPAYSGRVGIDIAQPKSQS